MPVNRMSKCLSRYNGAIRIKWTETLIPTTMVNAWKAWTKIGARWDIIHGPAPARMLIVIKLMNIKPMGSQARRSEADGSIVLLTTKIK